MSSHKEKYGVESYENFKKLSEARNKRGKSMHEYKEKLTRKVEKQRALKNKMK